MIFDMEDAELRYVEELEAIIRSAEAATASLILSALLSDPGLVASGKFTVENAVKLLKKLPKKKIHSGLDIAVIPAVISAVNLMKENSPVGSVYALAKKAVLDVVEKAETYYKEEQFAGDKTKPNAREQSARKTASWLVRSAVFEAQKEAAKILGKKQKQWTTVGDNRVRVSHAYLDGKTVGIDDSFVLSSGLPIRYPGDIKAPLHEVLNCRCVVTYK